MKLLTRLLWVVLPLLVISVVITAFGISLYSERTVIRQAREDGLVLANVLARSAEMSGIVEEATDTMISRDLTSSARILAQLVAVAEKYKMPPHDINQRLKAIVGSDDLSEIWITDPTGKAYLHSQPVENFHFSPDPFKHPQSSRFWPLLTGESSLIVQGVVPRELDGKPFKYVGVSGADKPRIVQVGVDGGLLEELRSSLGVQELLNRVAQGELIERVWVVNEHLDTLNYASDRSQDAEKAIAAEDQAHLANAIKTGLAFSEFVEDDLSIGAPIKHQLHNSPDEVLKLLRHKNHSGADKEVQTEVVGAILLHIPTTIITRLIANEALITACTALGVLFIGVISTLGLTRRIVGPVSSVTDAAIALQKGQFKSTDLDLIKTREDEVGTLAKVFGAMAKELNSQRETLEVQVRERTNDLEEKNQLLEEVNRQIEGELSVAHGLQQAILPVDFPEVRGYSAFGMMKPAKQLAGDFYDFIPLENGKVGILIADVSDKGVTASFFMAISRTILRYEAEKCASPAECLEKANRRILASNPMMLFVTVFYGVLDPKDGAFLYSNGGHLLPYRFNGNTAPTPLQATNGALLGISDDVEFSEHQIKLLPEDKLFLFSDGITEAFNWNNEAFGDGRLIDALVQNSNQTPAMIVQQTVAAVERFEEGSSQSDDITAVLLSRDF